MIPHKQRRHNERAGRSRGDLDRALAALRKGGKCSATHQPRFPNFGAAVAGALLASPALGQLALHPCQECSGWHLIPTNRRTRR